MPKWKGGFTIPMLMRKWAHWKFYSSAPEEGSEADLPSAYFAEITKQNLRTTWLTREWRALRWSAK